MVVMWFRTQHLIWLYRLFFLSCFVLLRESIFTWRLLPCIRIIWKSMDCYYLALKLSRNVLSCNSSLVFNEMSPFHTFTIWMGRLTISYSKSVIIHCATMSVVTWLFLNSTKPSQLTNWEPKERWMGSFYQGNFQFTRISILYTSKHNKWRTLHWYIIQRLIRVVKIRQPPALSPATLRFLPPVN